MSREECRRISAALLGLGWLIWCLPAAEVVAQAVSNDAESDGLQPTFFTPPAPALRPEQALQTFQLADGYQLELVAADPLIKDPVAMTFDPAGRIWVCEMRSFMPDIEGTNEEAPLGVISILHDQDADGVMDASTVFLDGLVLPRGLCWTMDGLLVCENGTIWLCRDVDGDDHCDERSAVCSYNRGNLEHSLNGLLPALDNWIYNAKEGLRLRRIAGRWIAEKNAARGQWGISQDNHGYLVYNVNASLIRGDLVPCYSPIAQSVNPLVDVPLYDEQVMYPIRPTPGINRGYLPGFLRPDGSLIEANSNCGPVVYRGDNLPTELLGNVFIPEPAGNLIRRQIVTRAAGSVSSRNAYDSKEFLASTDERFRPVNMFNAPDGTLYVVDMYRGIIQHGAFITPYLREQILSRQLDREINLGRIYRVVHHTTQPRTRINLLQLSSAELVQQLLSSNGWNRDMAQQLLVQRGDRSVVPWLQDMATRGSSALSRLHALWTLEGLNRLDPDLLYEMLSDEDSNVRASSVTLYQRFLALETMAPLIVADLADLADDDDALVRLQLVQTLGMIELVEADRILEPIFKAASQDEELLEGLLSGFAGKETEFLAVRMKQPAWKNPQVWRQRLLGNCAKIMWRQRDPVAVLRFCQLLSTIPAEQSWQQVALLEGIQDPPPPAVRRFPSAAEVAANSSPSTPPNQVMQLVAPRGRLRPLTLHTVPDSLDALRNSDDERLARAAQRFAEKLVWPGKDGRPLPIKKPLKPSELKLFEIGRREYMTICAGCHHEAGYGLAAKGPELRESQWLQDPRRLIRIVLHGLEGPITINGNLYNASNRLSMPGMQKALNDEQIAGVLTYTRREFVEDAAPIDVETVAALRKQLNSRTQPWTEQELLELAP